MTTCCGPIPKVLALVVAVAGAVFLGFMFRGDTDEAVAEEPSHNVASPDRNEEPQPAEEGEFEAARDQSEQAVAESVQKSEDARMTAGVVGKWKTVRAAGPRELVMKADGTATMDVTIESFALKLLFGKKMRLEIKWHIADGLLHMETVGGEPKEKVELLKSTYGATLAYPILELTDKRLLVKDGEDDPDHDWERVED